MGGLPVIKTVVTFCGTHASPVGPQKSSTSRASSLRHPPDASWLEREEVMHTLLRRTRPSCTISAHRSFLKLSCRPLLSAELCRGLRRNGQNHVSRYTHSVPPSPPSMHSPGPSPSKSWVDRLPPKIQPYFYLTRIDKPIGTLLLFYPCGALLLLLKPDLHEMWRAAWFLRY